MAKFKLPSLFRKKALSADQEIVRNAVNTAFLMGAPYTQYDPNAPTYIKEGYLYNPIVYSIVKQRADKAQSVPAYIRRVKDDNARKHLNILRKATNCNYAPQQYVKDLQLKAQAFDEEILIMPMERPNELQSWGELKGLYETFIATTGNHYIYMHRGEITGIPSALYVLPAHLIKIVLKDNVNFQSDESPIKSFMLIEGNQYIEFPAENVIHIKLPNPDYDVDGRHLYGMSPLRAALRNIQSSNYAIDNNIKTMLNGGAFGFIHGTDPQIPLTKEQADQIKERLVAMDASSSRLSKISGIRTPVAFTRVSLTTDELKPFDHLNYDQKQLANVLGWDDILLNNDLGAKYDNYQLALKAVVTRTTMPSLAMYDEAFNNYILPLFKGYEGAVYEHDFTELPEMQPDMKQLVDWLRIGVDIGAYTRDEFRSMTNFIVKGTPEMEAHTVQNDVILLEEAIANDFNIGNQGGI